MKEKEIALQLATDLRKLAESIEHLIGVSNGSAGGETLIGKTLTNDTFRTETLINATENIPATNQGLSKPQEKIPTLEEVRAIMAEKSREGFREGIKEILTKYGASNLSALDPKLYLQAVKEVKELK